METPYSVCIASSGDLLVTRGMDSKRQKKIVRFSGSKEEQTIPWEEPQKYSYLHGSAKMFLVLAICNSIRLFEKQEFGYFVSG